MNANTDRTCFLRRSLRLDGIASGLDGVLLPAAASPISALMGLADPSIVRLLGAHSGDRFRVASGWYDPRTWLRRTTSRDASC